MNREYCIFREEQPIILDSLFRLMHGDEVQGAVEERTKAYKHVRLRSTEVSNAVIRFKPKQCSEFSSLAGFGGAGD